MLEFESFFMHDIKKLAQAVELQDQNGVKYYSAFMAGMLEGDNQLGDHLDEGRRRAIRRLIGEVIGGTKNEKEAFDEMVKIFRDFRPFMVSDDMISFLADLLVQYWQAETSEEKAFTSLRYRAVIDSLIWTGALLEDAEVAAFFGLLDREPEYLCEDEARQLLEMARGFVKYEG